MVRGGDGGGGEGWCGLREGSSMRDGGVMGHNKVLIICGQRSVEGVGLKRYRTKIGKMMITKQQIHLFFRINPIGYIFQNYI